jgi:hypothetical protein
MASRFEKRDGSGFIGQMDKTDTQAIMSVYQSEPPHCWLLLLLNGI